MSDEFDDVFGTRPARPFAERLGRGGDAPRAPMPSHLGEHYRPYGLMPSAGMGEACRVTRWLEGTQIPEGVIFQYRFLLEIGFTGVNELRLHLPERIILVEGRHLDELEDRLARRQVTHITEHSPLIWPVLPGNDEATVSRIQFLRAEE